MNSKERLELTLNGQKCDRPPCICPGGMMNMVTSDVMKLAGVFLPEAHMDSDKMAALAKAVYDSGCFENYGVPFCMTVEAEEMGAEIDFGNTMYEPHVVKYAIETCTKWSELKPVNLQSGRAQVVIDAIKKLKALETDVPIIGNLTGPVSTAGSLMEPTVLYKELRKKKEDAHGMMTFVTEQLIKFGRGQIEAGADVIAISDPSGTGEILGPKCFEEFTVKYLNMLLDGLKDTGINTIVHICGQMHNVYSQINMVRSNALSFDSIVPMSDARKNLKNRVLMGNVSTYALEFATCEKVETLTRLCLKNGSDIISPACGLGMNSPIANVQAMLRYLKKVEENA